MKAKLFSVLFLSVLTIGTSNASNCYFDSKEEVLSKSIKDLYILAIKCQPMSLLVPGSAKVAVDVPSEENPYGDQRIEGGVQYGKCALFTDKLISDVTNPQNPKIREIDNTSIAAIAFKTKIRIGKCDLSQE